MHDTLQVRFDLAIGFGCSWGEKISTMQRNERSELAYVVGTTACSTNIHVTKQKIFLTDGRWIFRYVCVVRPSESAH